MTLQIDLSPEQEARLLALAQQEGLTAEEYLRRRMLVDLNRAGSENRLITDPEEWDREFVRWVESHNDLPALPAESFSRESFYRDQRTCRNCVNNEITP